MNVLGHQRSASLRFGDDAHRNRGFALRFYDKPQRGKKSDDHFRHMRNLRTRFVVGFANTTEILRLRIADRQRQISLCDLARNELRQYLAEHGARHDAATIIAGEADHIARQTVEFRQAVIGHADLAIPFRFELDIADLWEQALERLLRPGLVHGSARIAQRTNAAEHQTALLVETEDRTSFVSHAP